MKKITLNALLNHKAHNYKSARVRVETVRERSRYVLRGRNPAREFLRGYSARFHRYYYVFVPVDRFEIEFKKFGFVCEYFHGIAVTEIHVLTHPLTRNRYGTLFQ